MLVSIHKDCGEIWNWESIQASNPPAEPTKSNSNERLARSNLESYKPGLMDKLSKRVDSKRNELAAAIEDGKAKDEQSYQDALNEYEQK